MSESRGSNGWITLPLSAFAEDHGLCPWGSINVRPSAGNRSLEVQDHILCKRMREIVDSLVE